jgi:hypothetical protein
MVVEAGADVAVVAGNKAARVQTSADFNDVGANLLLGSSTHLSVLPHLAVGSVLVAALSRAEMIGSVGQG